MTEYILLDADINLNKWNAAVDKMIADARKLETLLGDFKVNVKVSESGLTAVKSDIDKLDAGATAEIKIALEGDSLSTIKGDMDKLDAGATAEVDVKTTGERLEDIEKQLNDLKTLAKIDLAFTVSGVLAGGDFASLPVIGTLVELDAAMAGLEGRTGRMLPDAKELIIDLYNNGWGESITQVAEVITQASNLGIAMDDVGTATEKAFEVAQITGYDTQEILRTMDTMVKNGLAPDFQTAADILVTGFQTGNDKGGDLLDTFNEYGSTFAQLKIDGDDALGFINSGLEAGIDNSDRIADAIRETGIRLGEMPDDPKIQEAFAQLDELSDIDLRVKFDAYQSGEISGGEFFGAFFKALDDANKKDPQKAKQIAATLVGTISEDFGVNAIAKLTPEWDKAMGVLAGRSETAGNTINNNLGQQLENLRRYMSNEFITSMNEAFDISGLIENAKTAIGDFMTAIQSGESIGGALEIALQVPGLEHGIDELSSAISNLLIGLLEVAANIGQFAGQDVSALRETIKEMTRGQLQFDFAVAETAAEFEGAFRTAVNRGFTEEEISAILEASVGDILEKKGIEAAQSFVGMVAESEGLAPQVGTGSILTDLFASPLATYNPGTEAPQTANLMNVVNSYVAGLTDEMKTAIEGGEFETAMGLALESGLAGAVEYVKGKQQEADMAVYTEHWLAATMRSVGEGMAIYDYDKVAASSGFDSAAFATGFVTDLHTQLNAAIAAGDPQKTERLALALGFDQKTVDTLVQSAGERWATLRQDMEDTKQVATDTATETADGFQTIADSSTKLDTAKTNFNALATAVISQGAVMAGQFSNIINALGLFDSLGQSALATSAGLGGAATPHAGGGIMEGASVVGERGPELVFPNEKMAVLNNQTTENIYRALSGMGGVTNTRNSNVTINMVFNAQSMAQAYGAGNRIADQVRGYAA